MAIVTRSIGSIPDEEGGSFSCEYDYDDALNNRVVTVRAINTTNKAGSIELIRLSDGRQYGPFVVPANTTDERPVSTNQQNRVELTILPSGKPNGCDVNLRLPA